MPWSKTFCLNCEKVNACSCGTRRHQFIFSNRLRPPPTKNKVKFRQFLIDCPQFPNMVSDELKPKFIELLKKVKFYNHAINGFEWTRINGKC